MNNNRYMKAVLIITAAVIILPVLVILIWTVTARWPWPGILPESWTLRTLKELLFGSSGLVETLTSSIILATVTAVLGTLIALMTARATEIYKVPGRSLISFASFLPLIVPGTVFAMGIQVSLIKMHINDTLAGVVIVHLVTALPYCIAIMMDVTAAVGDKLEEQAAVLGAGPFRSFLDTSLPQLLPGILSSVSMAYIISYSQYFTTLMAGGAKVKTLALVLVPYIQSGDRALASIYAVVFVGSALIVFFVLELLIRRVGKTNEA